MRSRVDRGSLIDTIFKNQLLLICGPEWTSLDRIIFNGGTNPVMFFVAYTTTQRA